LGLTGEIGADPASGQASAAEDGAAGDHVSGGEVRRTRKTTGADFGRGFARHVQVFVALQARLAKAASP